MKRGIMLSLVILLVFGVQSVFALPDLPEPVFTEATAPGESFAAGAAPVPELGLPGFSDAAYYLWDQNPASLPEPVVFLPLFSLAAAASSDAEPAIPHSLRNNQYFVESLRLANLAHLSFDYGDYDASANYAADALRYAQLSDEYVALQLKIRETNEAISAAKARLDWAGSAGASNRFPREYGDAQNYYNTSLALRTTEDWDGAIEAANKVIIALANVGEPENPPPPPPLTSPPLPAQYTVRAWAVSKDCLWNIAGRAWAYGDPRQWRLIYNANKAKLPQPDNPDLIEPGMVLDIPSIKGEIRQGMWDSAGTYSPLR
ncbi:hypothetical protein AGMMS49546_26370 [Spirochaetia bacterium]|nr:hypothetical protein AGMMS49546_26370 [Spirochaetia bacterium]